MENNIRLTGNNGTDILNITDYDPMDNSINLYVAHGCVSVMNERVPVEFLIDTVADTLLNNNLSIVHAIANQEWLDEYKAQCIETYENIKKKHIVSANSSGLSHMQNYIIVITEICNGCDTVYHAESETVSDAIKKGIKHFTKLTGLTKRQFNEKFECIAVPYDNITTI